MKKSIFLFFAAILCATNAWAWCGNSFITVNGTWCTGSNSYVHTGGKFDGKNLGTLTTFKLGGELQVYPKSSTAASLCYKIDGGAEVAISLPKTGEEGNNSKHSGEADVDLSTLSAGNHTIAVWFKHNSDKDDNSGKNFTATFTIAAAGEEPEPVADVTVHVINSVKWAAVACHHWVEGGSGTSWPGDVLSKTDVIAGYDVYTATFTGEHTSCIFNNNNKGSQTENLIVEDGKYYDLSTTTWYADKAAAEAALATPLPDETIYFVNNKKWTTINVYAWGGTVSDLNSWPGKPVMTKTAEKIGEYEVYSLTATQGSYKNLIFNDGSAQTADYVWSNGKYYWVGENANFAGETKENAENALATTAEDYYTVVGEGCPGLTWTPGDENNKMEKQSDNSYKLVKAGVELTTNVQWKITKNGDWWNGPTFNSANQVLSITKSGIYDVTFTLSADLNTATAKADLKEETNTVADCYISGNPALTGTENGWAGNEFKMEYNEATSTYEYTLTGLAANTEYEFKVVLGGSWLGYDKIQTVPTGVENKGGNIGFKLAEAGDVVVTYNTTNGITLSGNFAAPAPEVPVTLYFVNAENWVNVKAYVWTQDGDPYKAWDDSEALTDTGNEHNGAKIYSYTFPDKYNRIIWRGDDKQTGDEVATYDVAKPYYYQGVWYASLSEIPAPAETKYYIAGTQNLTGYDWQVDGLEIAKAGDVYKHTFSEMDAGTYEFKITAGTWDKQWGFSNLAKNYVGVEQGKDGEGNYNGNIKIVTEEAKNIIVIFDPANNTITLENWAEAAPTTISYVLMGVNGDWDNGIALTQNPGNADEYVLENQVIIKATDAIKVVTLTDGQATAWCGNVDTWSNATYTADGDGNIVLEDGIYTFYFKKNTDNIYINQTGYARNVTNKYGTICLPYASASTSGATFYEVVGKEDGKVYLGSVNTLAAGVPYIFEKSANQIKVVYTGDKKDAGSANGLVGTFADNTTVPNDAYILYGGAFCTNNDPSKPNKINAYRAYLDLDAVIGGAPNQMPGRRYIGMDVQGENEATGFENIVAPEGQTIKAIVNGQLVIIRGGEMYNVQGQKL